MKRLTDNVKELAYWVCGTDGLAAALLIAVVLCWRGAVWICSRLWRG